MNEADTTTTTTTTTCHHKSPSPCMIKQHIHSYLLLNTGETARSVVKGFSWPEQLTRGFTDSGETRTEAQEDRTLTGSYVYFYLNTIYKKNQHQHSSFSGCKCMSLATLNPETKASLGFFLPSELLQFSSLCHTHHHPRVCHRTRQKS